MLLLHEHREDNNDLTHDPTQTTTTALYSNSTQSGKSKNKWNKNRSNNRVTSKGGGGGPSSISTNANNFASISPSSTTQFAGIMGATPHANGTMAPQPFFSPPGYYYSQAPSATNNFGGQFHASTPLPSLVAGPAPSHGPNQQAQVFPHPFFQAQPQ